MAKHKAIAQVAPRRWSIGDWIIVLCLVGLLVFAFIKTRAEIGALVAPLFGYTVTAPAVPTFPTAAVAPQTQPIQPQPIVIPAAPAVEPAPNPTDVAASQETQPDDYQEQTKPSRHPLPTLEPQFHTNEQVAPPAQSEGAKPSQKWKP